VKVAVALGAKVDGKEELGCMVVGLGYEEGVQLGVEALRELLWDMQPREGGMVVVGRCRVEQKEV
jgi:hypothetical protein